MTCKRGPYERSVGDAARRQRAVGPTEPVMLSASGVVR